jgi:hypothetical protein
MSRVGFLGLPTELRLRVYRHLVMDCLADGFAADLRGIMLCCRTVHQEIDKEFIVKVWRLLRTKHAWTKTDLSWSPLRLNIGSEVIFRDTITDITITVPDLVSSCCFERDGEQGFDQLANLLHPIFRMPWSTLTIKLHHPNSPDYTRKECHQMFYCLINVLWVVGDPERLPVFAKTDRLIFNLGNLRTHIDRSLYSELLPITHIFAVSVDRGLPKAKRILVSLKIDGNTKEWKVVYELNEVHQKQVEGCMGEFKKTGNRWGGRRLLRSMDDLASDDDVEGKHWEQTSDEEDSEY